MKEERNGKRKIDQYAPSEHTLDQLLESTLPVTPELFTLPTVELAKALVGAVLTKGETAGTIVETEAYLGLDDLAAHASRGITERTKVIFGPPGRAYVYFIYGMHECLNVVAEPEGIPGCVLIRALAPVSGMEVMRMRRHWSGPIAGLANGPGKLTEALAITRADYGKRLDEGELSIRIWRKPAHPVIATTPRIGIKECKDWPLRFIWRDHPCLSRR